MKTLIKIFKVIALLTLIPICIILDSFVWVIAELCYLLDIEYGLNQPRAYQTTEYAINLYFDIVEGDD